MKYLGLYHRLLRICTPRWKYAIWAAVFTLIIAVLQVPMPFLTRYAIDNVFPQKDFHLLNLIVIALFILVIIRVFSNFGSGLLLFLFRGKAILQIQHKLFEHMEYLSMSFHNNNKVGKLVSRLGNDTTRLSGLMADTLLYLTRNILTFLIGVGALFFLHWKLALVSLALMPLFAYSVYFYSGRLRKKSAECQENIARVYDMFFETLFSMPIVKSFCLEKTFSNKTLDRLHSSFLASLGLTKVSLLSGGVTSFIGGVAPLAILWLGGREIMAGNLSLGSFVAFNAFLGYLYTPVQIIMGLNVTVQTSFAALERVFEILDTPKEDVSVKRFLNIEALNGSIKYRNVMFSYNSAEPVLKDISFEIKAGEKIILLGRSGSGKTTLVNLLLKFCVPKNGDIYVDGTNIKNIRFDTLRQKIGIVPQNPLVFSGTIKDNIRIGNIDAADVEIMKATKAANLYDFVASLSKGFDTDIGERGVKLSGGEIQRLAIARVILKNAPIMIFDEATSEIDPDSERLIHKAMTRVLKGKTAIFIAHRLTNIKYVDRIVIIKNGKIMATGSHIQLYKKLPYYKRLYDE